MNRIQRVAISDTLKVFLVTTAVALLLMTLGGGVKEGVSRGLPPLIVWRILPYLVPEMLRFIIPGCLLFAVCSTFGQMAAANEITALKSLGIHPLRVVWPVLLLAYALSMFTFWLYDFCAVWARPNMRRLVSESLDEIAYSVLRSNRSFSSNGVSIVVRDVKEDRLLRPVVTIAPGGRSIPITLVAEEARLRLDERQGTLRIECRDGQLQVAGKGSLRFPDLFAHELILGDAHRISEDSLPPAGLSMCAIPKQIAAERQHVADLEERRKSSPASSAAELASLERDLDHRHGRLFRLQAEPHRRLANGMGCLCFALVGVPVALGRRSADTMSIFFLCFVPILLVYYPLLMTGEDIALEGFLPQYSVWLADAVLLAVGVGLMFCYLRR